MNERLDYSRTYRASGASSHPHSPNKVWEQVRDLGAPSQGLPKFLPKPTCSISVLGCWGWGKGRVS